jgi:uncharacterized membrane protein
MLSRPELKDQALSMLRGKWTQPVVATLIVTLVTVFTQGGNHTQSAALISIGTLVALFIAENLQDGFSVGMLRFRRGREDTVNEMISAGFKEDYGRVLGIMLLGTLFIILWCLLLIIPGIIKAYAYAMVPYIAEDNPELGPRDCLKRSEALMYGHKMDLFILHLSFIGWILLGFLSLGIGLLWVAPWIEMTQIRFYEELKAEQGNNPIQ